MTLKITIRPSTYYDPNETEPNVLTGVPGGDPTVTPDARAPQREPRLPATGAEMATQGQYPEPEWDDSADDDLELPLKQHREDRGMLDSFLKTVIAAGQDPSSLLISMANAGTLSGNKAAEREADEQQARSEWLGRLKAIAEDVSYGLIETPLQTVGGARDAAQAAINGVGAIGDWLNRNVGDLGTVHLFDDAGNLSPRIAPSASRADMPQLPKIKPASTATSGAVRSIAQFLTGFAAGGKVLGAAAGSGFRAAAAKGAFADLAAFDGHEKRLADLIQSVPALKNPVTEFLASKEGEGELEGRFKRAVEGLGLGAAAEGMLLGLKAIKAARTARATPEQEAARAAAETPPAAPLNMLGDADAPIIVNARAKATAASRATEGLGVPDSVAARALSTRGMTPIDGARDSYVNFARINSQDDVKRAMADMAEAFKADVDAARRGIRTNAETLEAAAKIDAFETLITRRTGEALNAEQSVAARGLWEASGRKLLEVAEAARDNPSPENLFQFRKMLATHYAVQQEVIASRTETARALQSWAIPAGGSREQMRAIADMLNKTGGLDVNAEFAARIAALKNVPGGISALDKVVEKGAFAKSLDVVKEVWMMALLSNPKTHMVNTMSNTAVAGQQIVERFVASRLSQVVGSGEIPIGEAAAQWFGLVSGLRDAFRYAGKAFVTGSSGFGTGKVEAPFVRAVSSDALGVGNSWAASVVDTLGTAINLPGRALLTADEFYKTVGYRMELNAQAFRAASREVIDGRITQAELKGRIAGIVANPPEALRMKAADAAAYQTFTDAPGTWVKALNRLETEMANASAGGQLGATLLRFIVPFRNTPANIFKYTFERTPLAPLTQRYREAIAQGGAAADLARTRLALGSATILLATDLALDGHLTGSGPDKNDKGQRDALLRSGWQPYSVKIGDRYFAYNRMDPIGFTLGIGADLAEGMKRADFSGSTSAELQKAFAAATFSVANNALSKNYMRGMTDFIQAISEPDRQGPFWLRKTLGAFAPGGMAETARAIDPYMRATNDLVSRLKSRTPGLSSDLPLVRDLYGRPRSYQSGLGTAYDMLSPIYSRQEDLQPIDREMMGNSFYLNMPSRKVSGVRLTNRPEVYNRYLELQGQTRASELGDKKLVSKYGDVTLLDALNGIVTGAHPLGMEYKKASDADDKEKFIRGVVNAYRRAARVRLTREFPKVFEAVDNDE
jgi:hypothetical protein